MDNYYEPMDVEHPFDEHSEDKQEMEEMDVNKPTINFILCCHGSEINNQYLPFDFEFKSLSFFVESGHSLHTDSSQPIPTYICQNKYETFTSYPVNNHIQIPPITLWAKPPCNGNEIDCDSSGMQNIIGLYLCEDGHIEKLLGHQDLLKINTDNTYGILPGIIDYIKISNNNSVNLSDIDLSFFVCRGGASGNNYSMPLHKVTGGDKRVFSDMMEGQVDTEIPESKKMRFIDFNGFTFQTVENEQDLMRLISTNQNGGQTQSKKNKKANKTKKTKKTKKTDKTKKAKKATHKYSTKKYHKKTKKVITNKKL